ncbi:Putative membrane protein [Ignavibacterium album JCM 16511]|uniref:Putative membrane protein n=1 Tax=Ignavibacterium album (strain DSM 19864 / JCM 16511 / NBRC 101810 / Mat9-16) TaxID=945713 RepID=I0AKR4_IGNAJ|nr:VanZ family protein [Ignavibacterium album]AFH49571.1 Putative membrane protein [Ignavibacterium album JCM 16511]
MKNNNRVFIFIYLPLIFHWLTIFILTSLPSDQLPAVEIGDKVNHFLAFFVLGFFLNLTLRYQTKYPSLKKNILLITVIVAAGYGLLDELHQLLVPGRSAEVFDWVADFIGASSGSLLAEFLYRRFYIILNNFLRV